MGTKAFWIVPAAFLLVALADATKQPASPERPRAAGPLTLRPDSAAERVRPGVEAVSAAGARTTSPARSIRS